VPEPKNGVINGRPTLLDWPATLRASGAFDALATISPWPLPPLFVVRAIE
jgi:hypothetical protein